MPRRRQPLADADQPHMPAPDEHARQHANVRHAHETELVEDYVELVADLIDTRGEARAVDLAHRFGVAQATVAKMLRRLVERGLVVREPYRAILLTDAGRELAEQSRRRHALVFEFLRALGVPESAARHDAEGLEHHAGDETLAAMQRFLAQGHHTRGTHATPAAEDRQPHRRPRSAGRDRGGRGSG